MSFLTKLRYARVSSKDLLHNYKQLIKISLEYCSVAMHILLTEHQSKSLEHCQAVALSIILQEDYQSYESALTLTVIVLFLPHISLLRLEIIKILINMF